MALPDRWFRAQPDSSSLATPRLLARLNVHPDMLDERIAFYERALGVACDSRTPIPEAGLELATVGNLLLIGNPNPPSEVAQATAFTLLVASASDYLAGLEGTGADARSQSPRRRLATALGSGSPMEHSLRSSTTDRSPRRSDSASEGTEPNPPSRQ